MRPDAVLPGLAPAAIVPAPLLEPVPVPSPVSLQSSAPASMPVGSGAEPVSTAPPQAAAADTLGPAIPPPPAAAPLIPMEALPPRRALRAADVIAVQRHGRDGQALGGTRGEAAPADNLVGGGEDRMRYLAMVAATSVPPLRMSPAERERAITAARPRSRIECMRRCGSNGFCDPSSPSGCGGEYCLAGRDLV
jgi:hypothetical protein